MHRLLSKAGSFPAFLLLLVWSCGSSGGSSSPAVPAVDSVAEIRQSQETKSNLLLDSLVVMPDMAYYFPSTANGDTLSILLGFDPQGEGEKTLRKYIAWCRKYRIPAYFSCLSKNGLPFETTRKIGQAICHAARSHVKNKPIRFHLMGFSGGAKVAFDLAASIPEAGSIFYSGAPAAGPFPPLPLWGFAGEGDMNLLELVSFHNQVPATLPHVLIPFSGKHEWPPQAVAEPYFQWLAMKSTANARQAQRLRDELLKSHSGVAPGARESQLALALFLEQTLHLNPLAGSELNKWRATSVWQTWKKARTQSLKTEMRMKETYSRAMLEQDTLWWAQEIKALKAHRRIPGQSAVEDRLLGFLSLMSYTFAHQALAERNSPMARKVLFIYCLADPENSEAWYLSAIQAARDNRKVEVLELLEKALQTGFSDFYRFREEGEFENLQEELAYQNILKRLAE